MSTSANAARQEAPRGGPLSGAGPRRLGLAVLAAAAVAAPFVAPGLQSQMAVLWVMVVLALTWDVVGGQMGYNSFGNIVFFGAGMYASAVVQRALSLNAQETTTAGAGGAEALLAPIQYLGGLGLGLACAALVAVLVALPLGASILRLRGHYFAICTLGLGVAAGEIASAWDWLGAGSGLVTPLFPEALGNRNRFFCFYFLALAGACFAVLKLLYRRRFGLLINAIRDDEDKAEAMGLPTIRAKVVAWSVAAFFLALAGGAYGNFIGFIDPLDIAFSGATFGVWMILMAIMGGRGTLWGPILGAMVFHVTQELFWTFLLGWHRVAMGLLIVVIVTFLPDGILGWVRERRGGAALAEGRRA
ncbi:MAG: branched-chain amino acid ABC transporter permease [Spirochaetaceae bacterium]|nr:branched-chain amino acid ABC transporter permease [Spirochaetaceae bacterium]